MVEAQNTIIDGRHIRIEQARVNRTLFILRFSRGTTEQVLYRVRAQFFALFIRFVKQVAHEYTNRILTIEFVFVFIVLGLD
jgi:hypothetical protein